MKAIILAAGYATRMYPLTEDKPKALLPLGGRHVVDYIIDQINNLNGVNEIILVSNNKFISHFQEWADTAKSAIPISVLNDGSTSENDRLGAIGDINFALEQKNINEDIVVIAGDNYIAYPLLEQQQFFQQKQSDTICVIKIDDREQLKQFAVATLDDNNKVVSLLEKPQNPPSDIAVFATYFFRAETIPLFTEYLNDGQIHDQPGYFIQWLYKQKDVYAYYMNGTCRDLGTIEAYNALKEELS